MYHQVHGLDVTLLHGLSSEELLPPSVKLSASANVILDLQIVLHCGKLWLRNTEFCVIDQEMTEILLGRPLFKCIGFDLDVFLELLVSSTNKIDVSESHSNSESKKCGIKSLKGYNRMWYDQEDDDPVKNYDAEIANMGIDDPNDIDQSILEVVRKAKKDGMSIKGCEKSNSILNRYKEVLRIKLGSDETAKVEPYRVSLRPGHRPHRCTIRRYAPRQHVFIEAIIRSLESIGAVYRNVKSRWASPALAVPNPGSDTLRFTVDLRGVNKETEPVASAMPDLETAYRSMAGSACFSKIDMCHAYWQIPLDKDSQEVISIQTPLGVFSPKRILQGSTDAGNHFQSVSANVFAELSGNMLQWLDDFLFHASSEEKLLKILERFFELCAEANLKVHAKTISLFSHDVHFVGRIVDKNGIRFDPRRLESLKSMKIPEVGSDLQQFICTANWVRSSIPNFSTIVAPLHQLLEDCYKKSGKRTRKRIYRISLAGLWRENHQSSFDSIKQFLTRAITLAYRKENYTMCLYTDASETHWGSILTQVPSDKLSE